MVLSASFLILLLCWSLFALRGDSLTKQTRSITSLTKQKFLKMSTTTDADNKLYSTVGALGLLSNVVVDYSLYTLKTTGCGLPAGPFGLVGAAEGISYLAVVGLLGWSIFSKIKTGSGLPAGPGGILGAAEGITFLTVLGGLVIGGLNLSEYGYLPGFLPNDKCG